MKTTKTKTMSLQEIEETIRSLREYEPSKCQNNDVQLFVPKSGDAQQNELKVLQDRENLSWNDRITALEAENCSFHEEMVRLKKDAFFAARGCKKSPKGHFFASRGGKRSKK